MLKRGGSRPKLPNLNPVELDGPLLTDQCHGLPDKIIVGTCFERFNEFDPAVSDEVATQSPWPMTTLKG